MSWTLPIIGGESGATAVAKLNEGTALLRNLHAGPSEPANPVAYMLWYYTTGDILRQRNSANSAWIDLFTVGASGISLNATDGYRQTIDGWYQDNVAASQTAVALARLAAGASPTVWIAPRDGSVTGVMVKSNAARTAGTLTIEVFKNGVATGLTAVLDGTNTTTKFTSQAKDTDTFVVGDELDPRITTDAGWLPVTADIRASIEVET